MFVFARTKAALLLRRVASIGGGSRKFSLGAKERTWQQHWRRAARDGAASGRLLVRSLSAGIVGVGVLFVSWPVLDNVIAPVAVRRAMNSAPQGVGEYCGRGEELDKLDMLLEGTSPGIWILEGVGKTSLLRMEQARLLFPHSRLDVDGHLHPIYGKSRRPCTYINLRETSTVNDLVFQLVTHLYQPLGGLGNLITSYTQLVHAAIKLVGASDGDVYNAYQELFFSLYLTHLRRALSASTSTGPITPCAQSSNASSSLLPNNMLAQAMGASKHDKTALLVLDHADVAMALGDKTSEAGYQRLLNELLLLAIAASQDTGSAQVIIATSSTGRQALEQRVTKLGGTTRRLHLGGLSGPDSAALVRRLAARGGGAESEAELRGLESRAVRECDGDPRGIQRLVADHMCRLTYSTGRPWATASGSTAPVELSPHAGPQEKPSAVQLAGGLGAAAIAGAVGVRVLGGNRGG